MPDSKADYGRHLLLSRIGGHLDIRPTLSPTSPPEESRFSAFRSTPDGIIILTTMEHDQEPAANCPAEDIGDWPRLGYGLPRNLVPMGQLPPRANDTCYIKVLRLRRAEAWGIFRRRVAGIISFPWVTTQTGELGWWVLIVGPAPGAILAGATIVQVVEWDNPHSLLLGVLCWTPARELENPTTLYRLDQALLTWDAADLHPEWATLVPPAPWPADGDLDRAIRKWTTPFETCGSGWPPCALGQ